MIDRLWQLLTPLSTEAQQAAAKKAKELGFDPNRGQVGLDESLGNLEADRQLLLEAISKKKLVQLPITVQASLTENLEQINTSLTNLTNGADEVVNLVAAIERLHTAIWIYGLHNLSAEVLGYQAKLNQLKVLEKEANRLRAELELGLKRKGRLEELLQEAEAGAEELKGLDSTSKANAEEISRHLESASDAGQKAAAVLTTIQQNETTSTQVLATSRASNGEITNLETRIKLFFSDVDEYKTTIEETGTRADHIVTENSTKTGELINRLSGLEDAIKVQIEKATGFSLFHSFQTRQMELAKSKWIWAVALSVLVALSIGLTIYVLKTTSSLDVAFFVKLSLSLPIIFAIAFCTVQYGRERKLEEEYAFKSSISISLVPYQELVGKLVDRQTPSEVEKYTGFIVESIGKVFTSPTEQIFRSDSHQKALPTKVLGQVLELAKELVRSGKAQV